MNKRILLTVIVLAGVLLATSFVGTVMAKEKVDAELITTGQDPLILGKTWDTNGGIQQQRGNTNTFYHILNIGEDFYPVVSVNTVNARFDLETGYFVGHYDAVWHIPTKVQVVDSKEYRWEKCMTLTLVEHFLLSAGQ